MRVPLAHGSQWSHAVSLGYKFGAWDPEGEYERLLRTEMGYRGDLAAALEAAEVKQWKLAEELRVLREELTDLRRDLDIKSAEVGEVTERARRAEGAVRLKELEEKCIDHDEKIAQVFDAIRQLMYPPVPENKNPLGFRLDAD